MKLITKAEWDCMTPYAQGYCLYMQEEHPGSELKGLRCPYADGSLDALSFADGECAAMLEAQDSEE